MSKFRFHLLRPAAICTPGPWVPALLAASLAAACTGLAPAPDPLPVRESRPGVAVGFLPPGAAPNSLALLPPPPAPGSAAFAADQAAFREARALRGTPRWTQAQADAILKFPDAPHAFSCALGVPISSADTPNVFALLYRSETDAGASARSAKEYYRRVRPFVFNHQPSCTPQDEAFLSTNGSYPSGHSTIGWAWALILAELAPERTDAILRRGYTFGESRVVCGVHWESDVTAGRMVGAGAVARLHADPGFRRQLDAARTELAAARAKGLKPHQDCAAEAAALGATTPPGPRKP